MSRVAVPRLVRTFAAVVALTLGANANATLALNLYDDGFGGVMAALSGNGTTSGGLGGVIGAGNIGEYVAAPNLNNRWFTLANPLSFGSGHSITRIRIDHDRRADDIHLDVTGRVRRNTNYDASGTSLVTGLAFADLAIGSYAGSNSRDARRLGGFTLHVSAQPVPSPTAVTLLLGALAVLGWRRRSQT